VQLGIAHSLSTGLWLVPRLWSAVGPTSDVIGSKGGERQDRSYDADRTDATKGCGSRANPGQRSSGQRLAPIPEHRPQGPGATRGSGAAASIPGKPQVSTDLVSRSL
jgi:hypothetical protein